MLMFEKEIIKSCIVTFIATLFCIWLLKPLAFRIGLVDRPGGRKLHQADVPLIGGIAMFFGFCFALLTLHVSLQAYRGLLAGSGLLLMMGVMDDFNELGTKLRLFGQLLAALLLIIWGRESLNNLGNLFFLGDIHIGLWAFPLTVIAVMGFINSINMIDGQDGLAGGVALGQVILLLLISLYLKIHIDSLFLILIAVVLCVFLFFNVRFGSRQQANIFMGDSGATFIAFLIAWFAIRLSQANTELVKPMTILWILAFPLFDLISVSIYRIRRGKSPLVAGRDHIHHILDLYRINSNISTLLLCVFSVLLGIIGILMNYLKLAEGWQLITFFIMLIAYLFLVRVAREK